MRLKRISLKNGICLKLIYVKLTEIKMRPSKRCFYNSILVLVLILSISYTIHQYNKHSYRHSLLKYVNTEIEPPSGDIITFSLDPCGCNRTLRVDFNSGLSPYTHTTCSAHAHKRGQHQQVVAFSFFGDPDSSDHSFREYVEGIEKNLEMLSEVFPGWVMRVYHDLTRDNWVLGQICKLACRNDNIDLCYVKELPGIPRVDASSVFGMTWRFFPTLDPQVSTFLSRDLDSLFSIREAAAVDVWLKSDKSFHVVRDHTSHEKEMMGGMWGWTDRKMSGSREQWKKAWSTMMEDRNLTNRQEYNADQELLKRHVWPWARLDAVSMDSYYCDNHPGPQKKPFPTKRLKEPNNFIGAAIRVGSTLWTECPVQCRPKDHQDWTHC